jgi:hypothetical protein
MGESLVALRDRREQVIQLLTDAFANDLLDVAKFEDRTALAHAAGTVAELDALVADLAPLPANAKHTALVPIAQQPAALVESRRRRVLAIFSHIERSGGWAIPPDLRVLSVFGNATLDLREARFAPGVTEITARVVFGNLEVIVPPHLAVEAIGSAVFGTFEGQSGTVAPDPDRPILRLDGTVIFGSVEIVVMLPGETRRESVKRRRRERRPT